ncbi:MAG: aldo/keto reductase [Nanobdellota archaeon]
MEIPRIGFGTWQLEQPERSIKEGLDIGYKHIDTAEMYGNEERVGKAIKEKVKREEIFLTSKLWFENFQRPKEALEGTLERLNTDYLDLYLLHWPKEGTDLKSLLKSLKEAYDEGKIKNFGVSNFTIGHLKEIIPIAEMVGLPIYINQVEFHPFLNQKKLHEFCTEQDIKITAYSPLARGKVPESEALAEIGRNYNKTGSQVALRWLIQKGIIAIPKADKREHAEKNFNIFDFELSEEDMRLIDDMDLQKRLINPPFAEFE